MFANWLPKRTAVQVGEETNGATWVCKSSAPRRGGAGLGRNGNRVSNEIDHRGDSDAGLSVTFFSVQGKPLHNAPVIPCPSVIV